MKTPIVDCYDFSNAEESGETLDEQSYRKDILKLRKEVSKITDEIMLGDATKAKALLAKFEATV